MLRKEKNGIWDFRGSSEGLARRSPVSPHDAVLLHSKNRAKSLMQGISLIFGRENLPLKFELEESRPLQALRRKGP